MLVKSGETLVWTQQAIADRLSRAMEEQLKDIGRRVATMRKARGLSQEELAREAEVSTQTVSRVERGAHEGRRGTLRAIAEALEVSEANLIGEQPDPFGLNQKAERDKQLDRIEAKLDLVLSRLDDLESEADTPVRSVPPGPPAIPPTPLPKRAAQGRRRSAGR